MSSGSEIPRHHRQQRLAQTTQPHRPRPDPHRRRLGHHGGRLTAPPRARNPATTSPCPGRQTPVHAPGDRRVCRRGPTASRAHLPAPGRADPGNAHIQGPPREAPPQTAQTGGYGRVELTAGAPSRRRHGRWAVIDVTGSESVAVVEIPPVATAAQMVAGHITLDISCLDRLYLTGFVAKLQTPGGVIYFLHDHRGQPIASPALFEPIGAKFRKDMTDWAQANGVPVVRFKAGDRKVEVMRPYLEQAAAVGGSKVVAIGRAQEFASVWTATRRDTDPGACPQFSFTKQQRQVLVFYVYIWDERVGPGFIKICTYFPYPIKVWVNGHEWAKRQALAQGIGF